MKTAYKLKIENPCDKIIWTDMSDVQKGKFCAICTKNVIDFETWSDKEIIIFLNQSDESICGRLNHSQLNRIVSLKEKSQIKYWHKIAASLVILTSASNVYASETNTNEIIHQYQESKQEPGLVNLPIISSDDSLKNSISGTLIHESSKEPVKNATIQIEGTEILSETDSLGKFHFIIPENYSKNEIILIVNEGYGFEGMTKKTVLKTELPVNDLIIEKEDILIGEVVYVKEKKWWQFWKRR